MRISVYDRLETLQEKNETKKKKKRLQAFSPFSIIFSKAFYYFFYFRVIKLRDGVVKSFNKIKLLLVLTRAWLLKQCSGMFWFVTLLILNASQVI